MKQFLWNTLAYLASSAITCLLIAVVTVYTIKSDVTNMQESVRRIESKIDMHLMQHSTKKGGAETPPKLTTSHPFPLLPDTPHYLPPKS